MPGSVGHEAINMNKIGQTLPDWHLLAPPLSLAAGGSLLCTSAVWQWGRDCRPSSCQGTGAYY
jgi:hypothetical protein